MPKDVHRCANKLQAVGKSESSSWAICFAAKKKKREKKRESK